MRDAIVVHSQAGVDAIPRHQRADVDLIVEDATEQVIAGSDFASVEYINSKGLTANANVLVEGAESFVVARGGANVVVTGRATVEMNQVRGYSRPSTVYAVDLSTVLVTSDLATRYVGTVEAYDNAFVHVDAQADIRAYDQALVRNASDFANVQLYGNARSSFYGDTVLAEDAGQRLQEYGLADDAEGNVAMYTLDSPDTGEVLYPPAVVYPTPALAWVAHVSSLADPAPTIHKVAVPYMSLGYDKDEDQFRSLASLELGEEVDL
jgi:hypothetical protein